MAKKKIDWGKDAMLVGDKRQLDTLLNSVEMVMSTVRFMRVIQLGTGMRPEDAITMVCMVAGNVINEYCMQEGVPYEQVVKLFSECLHDYIKGMRSGKSKN